MREFLGQHFLKNREKLMEIVNALRLKDGDCLIEVGPGHGELTKELLARGFERLEKDERGIKIIAVEKDKTLAAQLKETFAENKNIEIISGDALKILPELTKSCELKAESYKVVGNIPYYITGKLLGILSELDPKPAVTVLTIQKEVAERIASGPPRMNLLAAIVQFWAKPEIIGAIPRKYFFPKPRVDSALIRLTLKKHDKSAIPNYCRLVKILFKQPRKTLRNNIRIASKQNPKELIPREKITEILKKLGIKLDDRAQNLSAELIRTAAEIVYNNGKR